jgi:hypothetical protein
MRTVGEVIGTYKSTGALRPIDGNSIALCRSDANKGTQAEALVLLISKSLVLVLAYELVFPIEQFEL